MGASDWRSQTKQVLEEVMASDLSQIYFNDPVDAEALDIPEYYTVIKKPMDLGTCKAKLMRGDYENASRLFADVQLVWSNCRLFNTPGSDVVEACEIVEASFETLWRRSNLGFKDTPGSSKTTAEGAVRVVEAAEPTLEQEDHHDYEENEEEREEEEEEEGQDEEDEYQVGEEETPKKPKKRGRNSTQRAKPTKLSLPKGRKPSLRRCLKLIKELMKDENAEPFLVPVDAEELGLVDYNDIVKTPMDLGTIHDVLHGGKIVGWDNIKYKSPLEFKREVQLIWSNCRLYNDQPEDAWIVEMCNRCEEKFDALWKEFKFDVYYEMDLDRAAAHAAAGGGDDGSSNKRQHRETEGVDDADAGDPMDAKYTPTKKKKKTKKAKPTKKGSKREKKEAAKKVADVSALVDQQEPSAIPQELTREQVEQCFELKPNARCPVCKVAKKGSCGSETSPIRCYRRQFSGLPYTPLTYEDMHRFACMIFNKGKGSFRRKGNKLETRRKGNKLKTRRSNLNAQVEKKRAQGRRARDDVESAKSQCRDLQEIIQQMQEEEEDVTRKEQRQNQEREKTVKVVTCEESEYKVKPLEIPPRIMRLGSFFF